MDSNNIVVMKIGGSVITQKSRDRLVIRQKLLRDISRQIRQALDNRQHGLVLIHGAGSQGHHLALSYGLKNGTRRSARKLTGARVSTLVDQQLSMTMTDILTESELPVVPLHPSSLVYGKNGNIDSVFMDPICKALELGQIPMLHGDMMYDAKLGMSICSGDVLAAKLAKALRSSRILFATDTDGLYDRDPFQYSDATLIPKIRREEVLRSLITLGQSHHKDATEGMRGKVRSVLKVKNPRLKEVQIFNGTKARNYFLALSGRKFRSTRILS
ncbi:MAG: isopentenyl phosphate kinase [bacterium]|nr:isopentenyl phosphate kinase [bacterium]